MGGEKEGHKGGFHEDSGAGYPEASLEGGQVAGVLTEAGTGRAGGCAVTLGPWSWGWGRVVRLGREGPRGLGWPAPSVPMGTQLCAQACFPDGMWAGMWVLSRVVSECIIGVVHALVNSVRKCVLY